MRVSIHVAGASVEELSRGARAAATVFDAAGVDALACAVARRRRDAMGEEEPTAEDWRLAALFDAAADAASHACCAGWRERVTDPDLRIEPDAVPPPAGWVEAAQEALRDMVDNLTASQAGVIATRLWQEASGMPPSWAAALYANADERRRFLDRHWVSL